MKLVEQHTLFEEHKDDEGKTVVRRSYAEERYDVCIRSIMRNRTGKELLLYILRDLNYFVDTTDEEAVCVRRAAIRLLKRIESAAGFSLDYNFRH